MNGYPENPLDWDALRPETQARIVFWTRRNDGPTARGHVFLAEAVHRIGKAIYPDDWTDKDPIVWLVDTAKESLVSQVDRESGFAATTLNRFNAVCRVYGVHEFIAGAAKNGRLATASYAGRGGTTPLPWAAWQAEEDLDYRFWFGQINPKAPFDPAGSDNSHEYIFVTEASLNVVVNCLSYLALHDDPIEAARALNEMLQPKSEALAPDVRQAIADVLRAAKERQADDFEQARSRLDGNGPKATIVVDTQSEKPSGVEPIRADATENVDAGDISEDVTTYKTGAAGAPTSMHLVLAEARRMRDSGAMPPSTKAALARVLAGWLTNTHPAAAPCKTKTITNNSEFTELYWAWKKSGPKSAVQTDSPK